MIVGLGTDICRIERVVGSLERHGERFARRILHRHEWNDWESHSAVARARFLARRFAAKEAAVKALGTGAREGIALSQVAVLHDDLGKPMLEFSGAAGQRLAWLAVTATHLSISDERDYAVATVILES